MGVQEFQVVDNVAYRDYVIHKAMMQARKATAKPKNCIRLPAGAAKVGEAKVGEVELRAPAVPDWAATDEQHQRCAYQAGLVAMHLLGHTNEAEANAAVAAKNPSDYHSLSLTKGERSVATKFARAAVNDVPVTIKKFRVPDVDGSFDWAPTLLAAAHNDSVYVARIGGHTFAVRGAYIYDPDRATALTLTADLLQNLVLQRGAIGPVVLVQNKKRVDGSGGSKRQKVAP